MNALTTKRILTLLVICLFVANMATLAFFWLNKPDKRGIEKGTPADFIIREIGFNESQKESYLKLVSEHQQAVKPVRKELKEAKEEFFSLLAKPNISRKQKEDAAKKASQFTEQLDKITFDHFVKVRKLCDAEQQEKFDSIIKQVLQIMAEPNHRGPHPPHGPMDGRQEGDMPPPPGPDGMPPPPPEQ